MVCLGAFVSSVSAEDKRSPDGEKFPQANEPHGKRGDGKEGGRRGKPRLGGPGEMFKRMDGDNDGNITKEEFFTAGRFEDLPEEKRAKLFSRLDRDGDGVVSREEIRGMRKDAEERARQEFSELDKDKDGGLDFEEFSGGNFFKKLPVGKRREIFTRMDANGDGRITPEDRPERKHHGKRRGREDGGKDKRPE